MASEPASIRYKNPGAMWGGTHARKWGATNDIVLKDGQSNHIAVFPTYVQGAAAQFDLWRRAYSGLTLTAAIKKWSGGNSSPAYISFLQKKTGISAKDTVTVALLASQKGLALIRAQAQWEAGKVYPMSDSDWKQAQALVFGEPKPSENIPPPPDIEPVSPTPKPQPKPLTKSKTMWGGVLGWMTSISGAFFGLFEKLDNPYTLAAFIIVILVASICAYLVIKGRIDVNKVVKRLSQENADA